MLDNSNETITKTEDIKACESSFGGFEGRFSYERCRGGTGMSAGSIVAVVFICFSVAMVGIMSGIVMFHIVRSYSSLYYPGGTVEALIDDYSEKLSLAPAELREQAMLTSLDDDSVIANVTDEDAKRYRVPIGVILKHAEEGTEAFIAGFRAGDIIVSIDDTAVSCVEELERLIAGREAVAISAVKVFRDNVYIIIEVAF